MNKTYIKFRSGGMLERISKELGIDGYFSCERQCVLSEADKQLKQFISLDNTCTEYGFTYKGKDHLCSSNNSSMPCDVGQVIIGIAIERSIQI